EIFAEVLGVERVGIDEHFWGGGGNGWWAIRCVGRVGANGGIELPIRMMFESPTVAELALRLREAAEGRPPLVRQERPAQLPLSHAQQRLWFIDQLEGSSTEYNMPQALRLYGDLDVEALSRAIQTIVDRHESLRTHFIAIDGQPAQIIEPQLKMELPVEDLSMLAEADQQERVSAAMRDQQDEPFNLSSGPVLRVKLLRLGEQEYLLLQTFHHIVSDGWSMGVFNEELKLLYEAYSEGRDNPLGALRVQYADFALWQRQWLDQGALDGGMKYWREQVAGIPERLELPADRPRPTMQSFAADAQSIGLNAERLAELKQLSQERQASLYMTLLSGFAVLLGRYSGQDDI